MSKRHQPDHEMSIMQRGLRDLGGLTPEGRRRVVTYWAARIDALSPPSETPGEQQLDLYEALPMRVRGGAAAA